MTAAGRSSVQTVLGPIAPADLGPTLMHEHLLCDIRHPSQRKPDDLGPELALDNVWAINYGTAKGAARNYLLDACEVAIDEVRRMLSAGGRSVVDLSSGGVGRVLVVVHVLAAAPTRWAWWRSRGRAGPT